MPTLGKLYIKIAVSGSNPIDLSGFSSQMMERLQTPSTSSKPINISPTVDYSRNTNVGQPINTNNRVAPSRPVNTTTEPAPVVSNNAGYAPRLNGAVRTGASAKPSVAAGGTTNEHPSENPGDTVTPAEPARETTTTTTNSGVPAAAPVSESTPTSGTAETSPQGVAVPAVPPDLSGSNSNPYTDDAAKHGFQATANEHINAVDPQGAGYHVAADGTAYRFYQHPTEGPKWIPAPHMNNSKDLMNIDTFRQAAERHGGDSNVYFDRGQVLQDSGGYQPVHGNPYFRDASGNYVKLDSQHMMSPEQESEIYRRKQTREAQLSDPAYVARLLYTYQKSGTKPPPELIGRMQDPKFRESVTSYIQGIDESHSRMTPTQSASNIPDQNLGRKVAAVLKTNAGVSFNKPGSRFKWNSGYSIGMPGNRDRFRFREKLKNDTKPFMSIPFLDDREPREATRLNMAKMRGAVGRFNPNKSRREDHKPDDNIYQPRARSLPWADSRYRIADSNSLGQRFKARYR
jgi:hypothetical protein